MSPLSRLALRVAYGASQLPRVAWYVGHSMAMNRLSRAARERDGKQMRPRAVTYGPVPDERSIYADMAELLRQDLANVEAGIYPLPADHDGSILTLLRRSRLFFEDLPDVYRRRESNAHSEVLDEAADAKRPRYYMQNFHFQSGGWLTEDSAKRYDTQVEVLFKGTANATRRQALPPLHEIFSGRDQRKLRLLDIGCGTGRFLDLVKQAWPRLPAVGLDLSDAYLKHARHHLRRWSRINLLVANAEAIPLPDASLDAVTSIFTFHELPPKVRRIDLRRMRAGAEAGRAAGAGGFVATRRPARLRRPAGMVPAQFPRALLRQLHQGGLPRAGARGRAFARQGCAGLYLQGDGVREAGA